LLYIVLFLKSVRMTRPRRGAEESTGEAEASAAKSSAQTSKPKQKEKEKEKEKDKDRVAKPSKEARDANDDNQTTLDKHLVQTEKATDDHLDDTLKGFANQLSKLASQEYIEAKFKQMVTEDFLSTKLKELEKEVKSEFKKEIDAVHKHVSALQGRVEITEKTVEALRNKVSDMETSIEKVAAENILIKKDNEKMKEQLTEREIKLKFQAADINNLEQYTRRNSVRIYGVNDPEKKETSAETAKQVVKLVKDKLEVDITVADIDIAHRTGIFQNDGNRPIICKFVSRFTKHDVIKARRKLKKSGYVIKEDLTIQNAKLLEKTKELETVESAWSHEGKIIALLKTGTSMVVNWKTDLDELGRIE